MQESIIGGILLMLLLATIYGLTGSRSHHGSVVHKRPPRMPPEK